MAHPVFPVPRLVGIVVLPVIKPDALGRPHVWISHVLVVDLATFLDTQDLHCELLVVGHHPNYDALVMEGYHPLSFTTKPTKWRRRAYTEDAIRPLQVLGLSHKDLRLQHVAILFLTKLTVFSGHPLLKVAGLAMMHVNPKRAILRVLINKECSLEF